MASLGKIKLGEVSPNHPFANTHVSFGLKRPPSSSAGSPDASVPADPMLPAMNGLEEAMLKQLANLRATGDPHQAPSPQSADTTQPGNVKD